MHMNTAPVARDVIEIFERHGEWREAEAKRLLRAMATASEEEKQAVSTRAAFVPGAEMVQYWGFVSARVSVSTQQH